MIKATKKVIPPPPPVTEEVTLTMDAVTARQLRQVAGVRHFGPKGGELPKRLQRMLSNLYWELAEVVPQQTTCNYPDFCPGEEK